MPTNLSRQHASIILTLLLFITVQSHDPFAANGRCQPSPQLINVAPDADVTIGVVLPVHAPGEGVYGCGNPAQEGVQVFESMRWAVDVLNRKSGLISDSGGGSLIPGVKIGLKVYDSCGHNALAIDHLTTLFPVLKSGPTSCDYVAKNSSLTIGVVDMSECTLQPDVAEAMRDYLIPSIKLSLATLVPAERMSQVLHTATRDLKWSNIIVLHEDEEYSVSVVKQLTQASAKAGGATCISSIYALPRVERGPKTNRRDLKAYRKIFRAAASGVGEHTGVIVVTKDAEATARFMQVMAEFPEISGRLQWLFSWIPPPSSLSGLRKTRLYSVAPYPASVAQFEEYWSDQRQMSAFSNVEDRWFLEYLMAEKGCKVSGATDPRYAPLPACQDRLLQESPLLALQRTSRAVPALTAVFTFATALYKAWESRCQGQAGVCRQLRETLVRESLSRYLEPVEFLAGDGKNKRVPRDVAKLHGSKLSLTRYILEEGKDVEFQQVIVYEAEGSKLLDESFVTTPSTCPGSKCRGCVRPRQSRFEDSLQDLTFAESSLVTRPHADILIPVLLPLHEVGLSPLECSAEINAEAVQNLEAAFWTLDHINEGAGITGPTLGLAVLDTCSSPLLATQRLATYVAGSGLELGSGLVVVGAGNAEETLSAASVLRPLNVTVVSASDLTPHLSGGDLKLGLEHRLLQVESPVDSRIQAALEVFQYVGWRFVSVIHEDTPPSTLGVRTFVAEARKRGVCVGQQFEMHTRDMSDAQVDKLMQGLIDAKSRGSRVAVLFTGEESTKKVLRSLGRYLEASGVDPGELVLVGLGEWGSRLEVFKGLEKVALGSVVFKQETGEVSEFSSYFQHLLPGSNPRNPWFDELWQQEEANADGSAKSSFFGYKPLQSTTNTIQAIVAVAAGFATLRNHLCQDEPGLCPAMVRHPQLQHLLSEHISSAATPRLDHPGEAFRFTRQGYGDTPIEVYNYRKVNGKDINYLKVGTYNGQYNQLSDMSTYTKTREIPMESVSSQCIQDCFRCQYSTTSHFTVPSSSGLYIAVALGIHQSSESNPLACGKLNTGHGFQNFESVLWALDTINADQNILPGTNLGAIVFDTCTSREKAAMDVSNFFSGALSGEEGNLPPPESVVGMVVDGPSGVVHPLVDLAMPLGLATVAASVRDPEFRNVKRYPHLLKMDLPSDVVVSSFVSVLKHFDWKYVSVVYTGDSDDSLFGYRGFEELKRQMDSHGIEVSVAEKVEHDDEDNIAASMDIIAHRLKIRQNSGARVVILLLSPPHISQLLGAVKRLQHLGRAKVGDFVWLAHDTLEPFRMFPDQSPGALVLRTRSGEIPAFKEYFTGLDVRSNGRNPWFREYWEQVFDCRGNACSTNARQNLRQVGFIQDRSVSSTVNGLYSLFLGLDALQRHQDWHGDRLVARGRLLEAAKRVRFNGLDKNPVVFGDQNYVKKSVDVYNFRDVGDVRAFVNVGTFDDTHGLSLNSSLTLAHGPSGHLVPLSQVPSLCSDPEICPSQRSPDSSPASYMKIPTSQEFVIGVSMPVHRSGDSYFTCSSEISESSFQTLLALSYALDKVNGNETVLPQIQLGALIFDHCGRRQKAEEQVFSFIASDGSLPYSEANLKSRAMVAALTFDPSVADDLSPLFESALIPQISAPVSGMLSADKAQQRRKRTSLEEERRDHPEVKVVVDILKRFEWKYISLVHSGSETDRSLFWSFVDASKRDKICIAQSLVASPEKLVHELAALFQEELGTDQESKVVVLLLDDTNLVKNVLEAAKEASVIEEYLWIGIEYNKNGRDIARVLHGVDIDFLLIRPETYDVPGFRDYYSSFSPSRHFPVPDTWFQEFWQHKFRCHLPQGSDLLKETFPKPCTGAEMLGPLDQDPHVYHTVTAVTAVADSLHDYLRRYCQHGDAATSLDDCGPDARAVLWREMRKALGAGAPAAPCVDGDCGPLALPAGYQVYQLRKTKVHYAYQQVGLWKDGSLSLEPGDVEYTSGARVESRCRLQCQRCLEQLAIDPAELNLAKPAIYANFRTLWGVVVTAVSMLGAVLVIICAAYFLISFQVTVGTTVLGYMILAGLLMLYAVNLAFVLTPSEATCGVRRFGMGLAYAVVFAGMLVKVMHIWRVQGCGGYHVTSPVALIGVATGLVVIQVVLCSAWLVLIPPATGLHGGEWRCHPATTFEDELVVSLVYCMLMLAVTMLFSLLTWHSRDNNREARWVFACCFLITLVWIAWTVVSTRVVHTYRDLTISVANLACATVVMLCMYLRKVYLYHRLTRDHEKNAKLQQQQQQTLSAATVPNMYGTLTRTTCAGSSKSSFNTGTRLQGVLGVTPERPAPSRMALIEDESASSDSGGSSQVQATDLYPLDMYDGGSQFQPPSLRLGGSSLVLEETQHNT